MILDRTEPSDLWYAPPPRRPVGYLHPSRMSAGRLAATAVAAARPRHAGAELAARLREHTGRPACVLTATGRAALALAVRQTGAEEVVLSTFNCPAVADAVLAAGARPVLVDADPVHGPAFTSVELAGRAVVLTNGLGLDEHAAHAERIGERGGTVVLDLAQACVAPEVLRRFRAAGCPLVLSFGEGKPLGGLGGGALLTSTPLASAPLASRGRMRRGFDPAPLRRAVAARIVAHAPVAVRAAVQRAEARTPGWSHTKADHLPTGTGPVRQDAPSRWEVASAAALLRTASGVAAEAAALHERVRAAVAAELTTCEPVAADPRLGPGVELLFRRPGQRFVFARALAERGIPSTWNYYPLHRLAPYARYAAGPMTGADSLWPRVLTVAKQPQPRLTAESLAEAMIAADRSVRDEEAGRD
ncbi:DegT/DnrJ/EryC1/StrS family aminotransferase [Streptomyces sp. NPDC101166]|uniref:DegT/DnrJ/EryC1/StrS family aminotransferase n=1 Tax=Streptomyces sp. NPDC101166 TaxID=3366120 RepID=UPI0038234738